MGEGTFEQASFSPQKRHLSVVRKAQFSTKPPENDGNMKRKPETAVGGTSGDGGDASGASNSSGGGEADPSNTKRHKSVDASPTSADSSNQTSLPPKYGTKEYWEARYKSHLTDSDASKTSTATGNTKKDESNTNEASTYIVDGIELSKEATKPGHAWYFSYEELRPLVMPLIFGDVEEEASDIEEYDEDAESWVEEEEGSEEEVGDGVTTQPYGNENEDETSNNKPDNDEEDQQEATIQLSKDARPKSVLEIGCGDVPLGTALAEDLLSMESDTGCGAELVVNEITCIDYSEIVVQTLIDKHHEEIDPKRKLQPSFRALDARALPYGANTYDLILEKGTLDAMLSDPDEGLTNCIKIVKEMARVCREGGAILIVSHLNANEPKGMGWLEDVVFCGLKDEFRERKELAKKRDETATVTDVEDTNEAKEVLWSIEVHGGSGLDAEEGSNASDDNNEDASAKSYGPAVYIIKKKCILASIAREVLDKKKNAKKGSGNAFGEDDDEAVMPPVKLEFLTY